MTTLKILRGVPAAGKTTYALELQKQGWTWVNRDTIRVAMFGAYWGKRVDEDVVTEVENEMVRSALAAGHDVVLDATNFKWKFLQAKLSIASEYDADVEFEDFPISLVDAIARDEARDRHVGADVIASMFKRYKVDTLGRALPAPPTPFPRFEPYVRNNTKPTAYIVDTDGTLADSDGVRNPYDTSKYHLDRVRHYVAQTVWALQERGHEIIGLSGRDEDFYDVTMDWWLDVAEIKPDAFFMRTQGDKRNDAIVKYELFKQHIEPNYNVLGAFDDRPRVIRMWRKIGVSVFDVGNGIEF